MESKDFLALSKLGKSYSNALNSSNVIKVISNKPSLLLLSFHQSFSILLAFPPNSSSTSAHHQSLLRFLPPLLALVSWDSGSLSTQVDEFSSTDQRPPRLPLIDALGNFWHVFGVMICILPSTLLSAFLPSDMPVLSSPIPRHLPWRMLGIDMTHPFLCPRLTPGTRLL